MLLPRDSLRTPFVHFLGHAIIAKLSTLAQNRPNPYLSSAKKRIQEDLRIVRSYKRTWTQWTMLRRDDPFLSALVGVHTATNLEVHLASASVDSKARNKDDSSSIAVQR
jgi:hypothetical protein